MACKLLIETQMTVEQIAERVGFRDNKYFYQKFKKITNFTPNNYRKNFGFK